MFFPLHEWKRDNTDNGHDYADLTVRGHRRQLRPRTAHRHNPDVIIRCTSHPRGHASYLREHGGDYVLIAKGNQPSLFAALDDLPWITIKAGYTEEEKGHGRRDVRVLKVNDLTDPAHEHHRVRFPGARQAFLIERYRHFADGTITAAAILGITSLTPRQTPPADLAGIIRGHWHIKAHHHVRDVTFKEDASRIRAGAGARVMAIIPVD